MALWRLSGQVQGILSRVDIVAYQGDNGGFSSVEVGLTDAKSGIGGNGDR